MTRAALETRSVRAPMLLEGRGERARAGVCRGARGQIDASSPDTLDALRALRLALDAELLEPSTEPYGALDVLDTAQRLDREAPEQVIVDLRDGISIRTPIFDDCGEVGPCTRTVEVSLLLQHPDLVHGTFDWRARTLGSSSILECGDAPRITVVDVTD